MLKSSKKFFLNFLYLAAALQSCSTENTERTGSPDSKEAIREAEPVVDSHDVPSQASVALSLAATGPCEKSSDCQVGSLCAKVGINADSDEEHLRCVQISVVAATMNSQDASKNLALGEPPSAAPAKDATSPAECVPHSDTFRQTAEKIKALGSKAKSRDQPIATKSDPLFYSYTQMFSDARKVKASGSDAPSYPRLVPGEPSSVFGLTEPNL